METSIITQLVAALEEAILQLNMWCEEIDREGYNNPGFNAALASAKAATAPGHTDLMVTPEQLDEWLKKNPLPDDTIEHLEEK